MHRVLRSEHESAEVCEVWYVPNVLDAAQQATALQWLRKLPLCRGEAFGRPLGRQQLWFHKTCRPFCTQWMREYPRWKPHPYTDLLAQLQDSVTEAIAALQLDCTFSGCLVNHYADGHDYIQPHRDEAQSPLTTVAALSLGATRTMQWRPVPYNADKPRSLKLPEAVAVSCRLAPGSVLLMAGATQKHWAHGIAPEPNIEEERFSLTFRE